MPAGDTSVAGAIRAAGWRQGHFIRSEDRAPVLEAALDYIKASRPENIELVVISQDCDLVAPLGREPFIELILGNAIQTPDPLCKHGRNPRCLHLEVCSHDNQSRWLEFFIHDRFRIRKKDELTRLAPNDGLRLKEADMQLLRRWIAKRYTRPAFPDAFNARLAAVDKRVERLLKSPDAQAVTGLFLEVEHRELADNEDYKIAVRITAESSAYDDYDLRAGLNQFEERFSSIIDECAGITIRDDNIRHLPEEDLTLAELRRFKRWDKDYRSPSGDSAIGEPLDPDNER